MASGNRGGFRFIDLFAGIGGFRWALERSLGGECVFASEWDKYAQQTYAANFGHAPDGDITKIEPASVPDHAASPQHVIEQDQPVGSYPGQENFIIRIIPRFVRVDKIEQTQVIAWLGD